MTRYPKNQGSESENELSYEKEDENSENIVARRDKRSGGDRGVNSIFVQDQRYEGPDQRGDDDHDDQRDGNGHADVILIVEDGSKQKDKAGQYDSVDDAQANFLDHSIGHAALDVVRGQTLYDNGR